MRGNGRQGKPDRKQRMNKGDCKKILIIAYERERSGREQRGKRSQGKVQQAGKKIEKRRAKWMRGERI